MNIYTTKLAKEQAKLPTKYDFQACLNARLNPNVDNYAQESSFRRTKKGLEGEELLLEYLRKFGPPDWTVVPNVWLDIDGRVEIDLVLITRLNVYGFEVKNYTGHFHYQDGICRLNQRQLASNCVAQTMRAHVNLKRLCHEAGLSCQPQGVLLFTHPDNLVEIDSKVDEITVLSRNQLNLFIQNIKQIEKNTQNIIQPDRLLQLFEHYEIMDPFLPKPLEQKEIQQLRGGIHCGKCKNFNVKITRGYVTCKCGFREAREIAIVRTICEYGVLTFGQPIVVRNLMYFFAGDISRDNLTATLQKHFLFTSKGRYSYYENKNLPLRKILNDFNLS